MNNAVVIVTYNRKVLLQECIEHVLSQTVPFSKIVIVDNHSTDGTDKLLHKYDDDNRFAVVTQNENIGGAGGYYEGMKALRNAYSMLDYVLLIDDDAMIRDDYMEQIIRAASSYPDAGGFAGTVLVDNVIDTYHRRRILSRALFVEKLISRREYFALKPFRCDCATFCGLVLRGSTIRQIGLPKSEYFLWYDDTEYTIRLMSRGGIVVIPTAILDHKTVLLQQTKSLLMRITWRHYYGYRNRYDTARLHFGRFSALMVNLQYHFFYVISCIMAILPDQAHKKQGRYNKQMLSDVIRDGRAGKLGKNPRYHP